MTNIYDIINENEHLLINQELCAKCKGLCCKLTPCSYLPNDIDMSKEGLIKLLKEGNSSIKVKITNFLEGDKIATVPIPVVGVRGRKKEEIDFLSPSVRCIALGSNGCELENKPTGAKILIPGKNGYLSGDKDSCYNLFKSKQYLLLLEWMKYYKVLIDTAEEFSQKSFEEIYLHDLIKTTLSLLYDNNISDYNRASLTPILENMKMFTLVYNDKISNIDNIKKPSSRHINYTNPTEKIYQRYKQFTIKNIDKK